MLLGFQIRRLGVESLKFPWLRSGRARIQTHPCWEAAA